MSYKYNDFGHFENTVNKRVREAIAEGKRAPVKMASEAQLRRVYELNPNKFTWELKNDLFIMDPLNIEQWMIKTQPAAPQTGHEIKEAAKPKSTIPLSADFYDYLQELDKQTGCFEFMFTDGGSILIGRADDLGHCLLDVYNNRIAHYCAPISIRVYVTENIQDSIILEPFLIVRCRPLLNREFIVATGKPTLTINNAPEPGKMVSCNDIEKGNCNDSL